MAESKTATFGIKIPVETNAASAGTSVELLRSSITSSQEAIKSYQSSLQKLRGKSDEVKAAKEKLKAAIESERDAVSRSTLALGQQGHTIESVTKAAKAAAAQWKEYEAKQNAAKVSSTTTLEQLKGLKSTLADTSTATGLMGASMLALAAAAVAATTAIAGAVVGLGKFVLESANALRTMGLFREAATGSASNAKAFGHQIEYLADRIPTTREELQNLSLDVSRAMIGTRVSGQGIIDTFNAVAQESAAMGDSAGKAIQGIIDRSKTFGRLGLGLNELQGTGITFQDVAAKLAENLKISIGAAQQQLRMGRVNVNAGAKAIRGVIEKNFGDINKRRMLDLDVAAKKFHDRLVGLTEGVDIEGLLKGVDVLSKLFDKNTVTGSALKQLITDFGNVAMKVFKAVLPLATTFFKQLVIESLKLEIAGIRLYNWAKKAFGPDFLSGIDGAKVAITSAKVAFGLFAVAIGSVAVAAGLIAAPFVLAYVAVEKLRNAFKDISVTFDLVKTQLKKDFGSIGTAIVQGLIDGFGFGMPQLVRGTLGLVDVIKNTFTDKLKIHSPSKVFEEYGQNTAEGYERGLNGAGSGAQSAANRLAPGAPGGSRGGGAGGPITVQVAATFPGVKDGAGVAKALNDPGFISSLVRAFEEAMATQGVPAK
jgi:hypothetical protein